MATNPLQKYFRQPKIFISLPSQGIYNTPDAFTGDISKLPVYGMTGMDEILLRTADALLSGETTARIIKSCIPDIVDPWNLSTLDIDAILASIRVATYGNSLEITRLCPSCETENTYSINLSDVIDFYSKQHYHNTVKIGDLVVTIRPLTYKQSTDFSLKNFGVQQRFAQLSEIKDELESKEATRKLLEELTVLRNEVFSAGIESVAIGNEVVTDRQHISEWLANVTEMLQSKLAIILKKIKLTGLRGLNKFLAIIADTSQICQSN